MKTNLFNGTFSGEISIDSDLTNDVTNKTIKVLHIEPLGRLIVVDIETSKVGIISTSDLIGMKFNRLSLKSISKQNQTN